MVTFEWNLLGLSSCEAKAGLDAWIAGAGMGVPKGQRQGLGNRNGGIGGSGCPAVDFSRTGGGSTERTKLVGLVLLGLGKPRQKILRSVAGLVGALLLNLQHHESGCSAQTRVWNCRSSTAADRPLQHNETLKARRERSAGTVGPSRRCRCLQASFIEQGPDTSR